MTPREIVLTALGVTGLLIFGYYLLVNGNYLFIHLMALLQLRDEIKEDSWDPTYEPFTTPFLPGIAIVVPAYNEASVIVESLQSLLTVNYPDKEVIVVNDGSTDSTLETLRAEFSLERIEADVPLDIPSEEIRSVYRSGERGELLVIDKENGGKSDALNAGVWLTDKELFCAVDADSIVEKDSLLEIVRPFLEKPRSMVAVRGTVRVANHCEIEYGQVTDVNLDTKPIVGLQVMEYLRAFYSGRLGLSRLKGLILISGAFGLFRTQVVREIGGYREDTITEDFDLMVRLHRYLIQEDREYDVEFLPQPVIWTEVPESLTILSRQRRRWYRGLVETLWTNRDMIGNPRYGRIGTYILPMFAAAEMLGPLIEGLGYILVPLAAYFGVLNLQFLILYFVVTTAFGVFLSWFGVYSEVTSFRRYENPREILSLLGDGVLENFGYRQWKAYLAWRGLFEYLRGDASWGVMERSGFSTRDSGEAPEEDSEVTDFVWADPVPVESRRPTDAGDGFRWGTVGARDEFIWGAGGDGFIWAAPVSVGFRWGVVADREAVGGITPLRSEAHPLSNRTQLASPVTSAPRGESDQRDSNTDSTPIEVSEHGFSWGRQSTRDGFLWGPTASQQGFHWGRQSTRDGFIWGTTTSQTSTDESDGDDESATADDGEAESNATPRRDGGYSQTSDITNSQSSQEPEREHASATNSQREVDTAGDTTVGRLTTRLREYVRRYWWILPLCMLVLEIYRRVQARLREVED